MTVAQHLLPTALGKPLVNATSFAKAVSTSNSISATKTLTKDHDGCCLYVELGAYVAGATPPNLPTLSLAGISGVTFTQRSISRFTENSISSRAFCHVAFISSKINLAADTSITLTGGVNTASEMALLAAVVDNPDFVNGPNDGAASFTRGVPPQSLSRTNTKADLALANALSMAPMTTDPTPPSGFVLIDSVKNTTVGLLMHGKALDTPTTETETYSAGSSAAYSFIADLISGQAKTPIPPSIPSLRNLVKQSFTNVSASLTLPGMSLVAGADDSAARAYFVMATRHASIYRSVSSIGFIDVTEWGSLTWSLLAGQQFTAGGWKVTHDLWISSPLPALSGPKTGTLSFNLSGTAPQILAMAGIVSGLDEARGSFGSDGFAAPTPSATATLNFNTTYAKKPTLTLNTLLQIDDVSTVPTVSPAQVLVESVAHTNMLMRLYDREKIDLATESFSFTGGSGERMATSYEALGVGS